MPVTVAEPDEVPVVGSLGLSAAPNPFNSTTEIRYQLARATAVVVTVHDVGGRHLATLAEGQQAAGEHVVAWAGLDAGGLRVPSGIYLVRLAAGERSETVKLVLVE